MVMLNEDRKRVAGQLKQLHDLERDERITVIAAHDLDQWRRLTERGWIGAEFEMLRQAGGQ
jgi:hypothetical protein